MKYSSLTTLSNVCDTSPARKTAVKCHSNRYASTAIILALLIASNSALGYTDYGGALSPPLPIGDPSVEHDVNVAAGSCVIADIDVILAYEHDYSEDLDITLTAPDGTVVGLVFDKGNDNTVDPNYPITFNDESPNPISNFNQYWDASPPPVTEFQSEGGTGLLKLSGLYGKAATGDWTLAMNDDCNLGGQGFLHSAILRITCVGGEEPESPPTLSGKAGKGLKGPSKSGKGVKDPQVSGKGSKVEESDSEMEFFNAEGALDEVWSFANLEEQSVSMSL